MAFTPGSQDGPMSEINVTPLVDVMLVLLIIFMVTAPLMQQGVEVALPETQAETLDADEQKLVLTLTRDQRAYLGQTEIPLERLEELLATNEKLRADGELYLHADQALPYGVVVRVMAAAKRGGATQLAMITDPVTVPGGGVTAPAVGQEPQAP